jgi:MFS transporter, DHA1 family, multidrug resistance protein
MQDAGSRGARLRLLVILGASSAFGPLSIDMYLPSLPSLSRDLGAPGSQVQLTLTACLAGLALGQALAGPVSDALGRRRPLLLGLAAYSLASWLCALAPSAGALAGLRLVQGLAGAAGIVIARAMVRDRHEGVAAARYFSMLMLVSGLAPILAPLIGGQILRVTSWRGVFAVLGAYGAVLLCAAAAFLRESLPPERRRTGGLRDTATTFRRLGADSAFLGYTLACGLGFAGMFAYISGSPFVYQDIYGTSPQLYGLLFGMNAFGLLAATQLNARLVGRVPPRRLLGIGLASGAAGGVALLAAVAAGALGLAGILPPLFVVVASLGLVLPNATALAMSRHPEAAGSASAMLGVLQFLFGAAAAPLVGLWGTGTALPMAVVIALLSSGAVVACRALARPERPVRGGRPGSPALAGEQPPLPGP